MNWWGSIKKNLPEAVRQLPATYFYKSTGPGPIASSLEWEQTVELASGLEDDTEGVVREQAGLGLGREQVINVDDSKPLVEGWLAKQTILHSTTNRTPWRNRYFILKRGCIHYYDVIAEDSILLKDFAVEHESSRLPVKLEGTEKFGYLLTLVFDQPITATAEGREVAGGAPKDMDLANRMLYLAAESEEERNSWLDWFVNVALGSESEQRKGWLMVRDKRSRAWKNRYFTLKGKTLHQHHRDQKGIFPLAGAEVWSRDGFSFSVRAKSGKILNLMADSQDVRDKWLRLIQRVIKHYQANELHQTILEREDYDMIDFTHKVKDWVDTERPRVERRVQDFLASGASSPPTSSPDGKFRIVSIDGGGMRGLMNCILLNRLLGVFPDLFEKVNFWVGTSNGGMLAMAFAFGYSPSLCRTILELAGTKVFIKREGYTGSINKAKFSSQALRILCDEIYGKYTLGQCPSFVLLPSFLLDNHAPDPRQRSYENCYYHNLPKGRDERVRRRHTVSFNTLRQRQRRELERKALREAQERAAAAALPPSSPPQARRASPDPVTTDERHRDDVDNVAEPEVEEDDPHSNQMLSEVASDVVLRTIAAPTYFPSHQQHVDGGMFAHDPASSALTLTISPYWLNKRLDEIILLSFGTGKVNHYYEDESHDWGYMQWVPKLPSVLWDGMIMQSEHMCQELLGDRYFRFNPVLQTEIPLDNPEAVPLLLETALNIDLEPLVAWITEHFYNNTPPARPNGSVAPFDAGEVAVPVEVSSTPLPGTQGGSGDSGPRACSASEGRPCVDSPLGQAAGGSPILGKEEEAGAEARSRQERADQMKREREAIEMWERKEQEERERKERMERMEREKKERERREREARERREREERERLERERSEREELERRERERRELEERERLEMMERERQAAEERLRREEAERRERERLEQEERRQREREELEAIARRAQQMREIEEAERRARQEQERQEQVRCEEEARMRRELEEQERVEIEARQQRDREREEQERREREEREQLERSAREQREKEERERSEAVERERRLLEEPDKSAKAHRASLNFFQRQFSFEALLGEQEQVTLPDGHHPQKRERTGSTLASTGTSPSTTVAVDDLFSFLTISSKESGSITASTGAAPTRKQTSSANKIEDFF